MSDREFYKIFSGLLVALAAITVIFFVVARMIVNASPLNESQAKANAAVAERTQPVGQVTIAAAVVNSLIPAANAATPAAGQQVYQSTCVACHGSGVAGAPKMGDKAAWKKRIAKGLPTLEQHAINGYKGSTGYMPAKGGNSSLSDGQVKSAVQYMVAHSK